MAIADDINRLVRPASPDKQLDAAATPDAIRAKTATTPKNAGKVDGAQVTVKSTDGLFSFTVTIAKT